MSFTRFLLRLFGRSPEQLQEQERFEQSLRELALTEQELDDLLYEIREVDEAYQGKKETFESMRPPISELGEPDVRTAFTSDVDM